MLTRKSSTEIFNFMSPGVWVLILGQDQNRKHYSGHIIFYVLLKKIFEIQKIEEFVFRYHICKSCKYKMKNFGSITYYKILISK